MDQCRGVCIEVRHQGPLLDVVSWGMAFRVEDDILVVEEGVALHPCLCGLRIVEEPQIGRCIGEDTERKYQSESREKTCVSDRFGSFSGSFLKPPSTRT